MFKVVLLILALFIVGCSSQPSEKLMQTKCLSSH